MKIDDVKIIIEVSLLLFIQFIPKLFVGPRGVEPVEVVATNLIFLVGYLLYNYKYINRIPSPIKLLSLTYVVVSLAFVSSGELADLVTPLRDAMLTSTVMGVLAYKYNDEKSVKILTTIFLIIMPIVIWQSVMRNNISLFKQDVTRQGLSLIGHYGVIIVGLILMRFKDYGYFFCIPAILFVVITSSRAALIGSLIVIATYYICSKKGVRVSRRAKVNMYTIIYVATVVMIGSLFFVDLRMPDYMHRSSRVFEYANTNRISEWFYWAEYFYDRLPIIGDGIVSYYQSGADLGEYPHNAYLHILNGGGIVSFVFYIFACILIVMSLFKSRGNRVAATSLALMLTLLFRGMFEIELIGQSFMHIVSMITAYLVGVGLSTHANKCDEGAA